MRTAVYTARKFDTKGEWLKGRSNTIGASEVPMVLGIAPKSWGTPLDLWERKRRPVVEESGNADTLRGSLAEEHIRELLGIENADLQVRDMTGIIFKSKKFPHLSCSLDAAIVHDDGTFTIVEIKDVRYSPHWKSGAYPLHYKMQCATQMLVTGARDAILLARINYDFGTGRTRLERLCNSSVTEKRFLIKRSEVKGQFAGIVRETEKFWRCVKDGVPPEIKIRSR